jgi:signal transduction histidine kinase
MSAFFDQNMVIVFFFYGLAFFSMGLAVWLEAGRSPEFRSARALLFLAAFGLLHGFHEWLEVFTILLWAESADSGGLLLLEVLRVVLLAISFLILFLFGLRLIYANWQSDDNGRRSTILWTAAVGVLWFAGVMGILLTHRPCGSDCIVAIDVLSRYTLAIPAALLAAWALMLQRKAFSARGLQGCARDITWAAVALLLYGVVGQAFPRANFLFPSNLINADLFREVFGIPVQLFRGILAAGLAIFVIRAMRAFELERRRGLVTANEARLEAQREALAIQNRARSETETLNRELQEVVQDLTMLFELSRSLAATFDRDMLLREALDKIHDSVPRIHGGMILLRDESRRPREQRTTVGYKPNGLGDYVADMAIRQAGEVGQAVLESGESMCWTGSQLIPASQCACTTGVPDLEQIPPDNVDRTMGMPLVIQERVAGSIVLSIDGKTTWLTPRDISLIRTVASQLSLAVANAMLYQEVQGREELRGELLHQIVSAQEQERQRIARDLHDGAGQMATALGLGLAAAGESLRSNPELGQRQLAELREMSGQLVQELQRLIAGLRPSILDDLGLVPALRGLVQEFENREGIQTRFWLTGEQRRIRPDVETIIFRIAQESLTNVSKHASASSLVLRLDFAAQEISLQIEDDGRGFDVEEVLRSNSKRHWGLLGIKERVALVGGQCDFVSGPDEGTTIQVSVPLSEEAVDVQDNPDTGR